MARVEDRELSDGTMTFRVNWVLGGGRWEPGKKRGSETFGSRAKAESFAEDVDAAGQRWPKGWVKGQGYVTASTGDTFADVAAAFLAFQERRIRRGHVKAKTIHDYRRKIALHLDPMFGAMPFREIGSEDVDDWVDAMTEEGWSPKSIRNWHGILYSVMNHGQQRMELRHGNPCTETDLPVDHEDKRHLRFFQPDEWRTFRSYLKDDVQLLVDVLIMTGMRWGEVCALNVGDVTIKDDGSAVLHIQRAWSTRAPDDPAPIRHELHESKKWVLGTTKNKKSRRVVVSGAVADDLSKAVIGREPGDWLFTRTGTPWRYDDFHYERWARARKLAHVVGLEKRLTPHMLRHTAVVWSLADGVPIEKISAMLGHASIQITYDVYGGLLDLTDPQMAQAMARRLTGGAE